MEKIEKLAGENSNPSITISLTTHRTHPDNTEDAIVLKNLVADAGKRLLEEYTKREVAPILEKLQQVHDSIDHNYNLDSLHIFISGTTAEVIKLPHSVPENRVFVDESFAIKPLIDALNRTEEYAILLLSQNGVQLFEAQNDAIREEIVNTDFPFTENPFDVAPQNTSHARIVGNQLKEYLNYVDKAVVREFNRTGLQTVVIATPENYRALQEVADRPAVYQGHAAIDYNNTAHHQIAAQAWDIVKGIQSERKARAISEMKEAAAQSRILTDVSEIYRAALEGRGELLVVNSGFSQPARITGDNGIELVTDPEAPGVVDDIVSTIAWKVLSAKGRTLFTTMEALNDLGQMVLKVRY